MSFFKNIGETYRFSLPIRKGRTWLLSRRASPNNAVPVSEQVDQNNRQIPWRFWISGWHFPVSNFWHPHITSWSHPLTHGVVGCRPRLSVKLVMVGDGSEGVCMTLVKTHSSDTMVYSHLLGK